MADAKVSNVKEMPALGRPFDIGMLYDCRADMLVTGMTLWDHENLDKDIRVLPKPNTELKLDTSSSISDKSNSLGVNAGLKASFCSGLVSVEGSANYLNNSKTSKNQARVTFHYKTTTEFKELTMNHLGGTNVKYPDVYEKDIATHVVTGILYGAEAFFVFDREVSDTENIQDIQGELKVSIQKIPCVQIEGNGKLNIKDEDMNKLNKVTCTFHGDVRPKTNPVTFEEAVKVFQELPTLLGPNGENAVPVKVWLLPLSALDSQATKLVREISEALVHDAAKVLEDFGDLEMRCNDILQIPSVGQFPQITKTIQTFLTLCHAFKTEFQGTLAKKLPAIRGGGEEEKDLAEILKKRGTSPFNSERLNQWLDTKEKEASIAGSLINLMTNTKVLPSQNDLYKEVPHIKKAVCFALTSLESADPYISALEKYIKAPDSDETDHWAQDKDNQQWYDSGVAAIKDKAILFRDFAEANKNDSNIKFLALSLKDTTHPGSAIYLYEDGLDSGIFEPPSKPEAVEVVNVEHNSVTLEFSAPRFGIKTSTKYRVEYCVSGETEWHQQTESEAGSVTVTGLRAHTEYMFRVRAITDVGVGPAAQVDSSIKMLPCGPPENLSTSVQFYNITVTWNKSAEIGQDVEIKKYIVEYKQVNEDQWKQEESESETKIISGLQKNTAYDIRVLCDCGVNGRSRISETVTVTTAAV